MFITSCSLPKKNLTYSLIVNAATGDEKNEGLGDLLCQTDQKGQNKVNEYASRQLLLHKKYTPFLVEMAPIVWAMKHFDTYLRGRTFTVYSDHKPLEARSKRHKKH
jgi:hypothetical protein